MYSAEEIENDLETVQEPEEETAPDEHEENENNEEADEDKKEVKPKKVARNPQPKLNEELLKGKRGLLALEDYFKNVKFKGRGYEEHDLSVLMKTYEYWSHRLFPKYPFDECIHKFEKLGTKRPVQTYLKRIKMNLLDELQPPNDLPDENSGDTPHNDEFDTLVSDPASQSVQLTEEQLELVRINREKAEKLKQERLRKAREKAQASMSSTQNHRGEHENDEYVVGSCLSNDVILQDTQLTEQQLERIKLNREKAEKLKQKKNKVQDASSSFDCGESENGETRAETTETESCANQMEVDDMLQHISEEATIDGGYLENNGPFDDCSTNNKIDARLEETMENTDIYDKNGSSPKSSSGEGTACTNSTSLVPCSATHVKSVDNSLTDTELNAGILGKNAEACEKSERAGLDLRVNDEETDQASATENMDLVVENIVIHRNEVGDVELDIGAPSKGVEVHGRDGQSGADVEMRLHVENILAHKDVVY